MFICLPPFFMQPCSLGEEYSLAHAHQNNKTDHKAAKVTFVSSKRRKTHLNKLLDYARCCCLFRRKIWSTNAGWHKNKTFLKWVVVGKIGHAATSLCRVGKYAYFGDRRLTFSIHGAVEQRASHFKCNCSVVTTHVCIYVANSM